MEEIECLSSYYGSPSVLSDDNILFPPILNRPSLIVQYEILKRIVYAKCCKSETKHQSNSFAKK